MPDFKSGDRARILNAILAESRHIQDPHAREVFKRAAVETGLVESNLTNPSGGDADSAGWRQERASLYPNPTNIEASARRFRQEFQQLYNPGEKSYQVAAQVQRPAAQYRGRYQQRAGEAARLLAGLGGSSPAPRSPGARTQTTMTQTTPGVDNSAARAAAIQQFLGTKGADSLDFAMQIRALRDVAGRKVTTTTPGSTPSAPGKPAAGTPAAVGGSGRLPTARPGKIIGTPYAGTHTLGNWQSDNAVDIAVPVGTPMVALQDGVVLKVTRHPQGAGRFAGDQITVRGANGNEYFYAHGVAHVKPGQRVRKGQSLGTTGSANGVAHLHFGQMKGDPRQHT